MQWDRLAATIRPCSAIQVSCVPWCCTLPPSPWRAEHSSHDHTGLELLLKHCSMVGAVGTLGLLWPHQQKIHVQRWDSHTFCSYT